MGHGRAGAEPCTRGGGPPPADLVARRGGPTLVDLVARMGSEGAVPSSRPQGRRADHGEMGLEERGPWGLAKRCRGKGRATLPRAAGSVGSCEGMRRGEL